MTVRGTMVDIGTFNKRVALTGAGWSRNWGGKLASEVWQDLIGHPSIQSNPHLRELLLREQSFEEALGATQLEPFTDADRQTFQQALLSVFVAMDKEIGRHDHDPWINIYKVQDLLFQCWRGRNPRADTGYIFTLNQDLWLERNLYNEHMYGAPRPSLPGLRGRPNQGFFTAVMDISSHDLSMEPAQDPVNQQLPGNFNIVKLHGSFNWRAGPQNTMVVGTGKMSQIAASPLLAWYFDIFSSVLSAGDVQLLVVGYGFGDEHVNAAIADGIEHHGLKLFIWDTGTNLRDRVLAAPHGTALWKGLLSTATRQLIEVFPSNQAETEEYRRIRQTCFG